VLADPHGNAVALNAVLEDASGIKPDRIVIAGDLVGYGPEPGEVIDIVRGIDAIVIKGNHDESVIRREYTWMNVVAASAAKWTASILDVEHISYLSGLESEMELEIQGRKIGIYHGAPGDPTEYVTEDSRARKLLRESEMDILICGHTHVPMLIMDAGKMFLNPGGIGQPRDGNPDASYAVLDPADLEVEFRRVGYDIQKVQRKILDAGLPDFLAARLSLGI